MQYLKRFPLLLDYYCCCYDYNSCYRYLPAICFSISHNFDATDADRLAVACKHKGFWQVLTGNQIGTLFAWWIFTNYVKQHPECNKGI